MKFAGLLLVVFMSLTKSLTLGAAQSLNLDFNAQGIVVNNPTGKFVYVRLGGNDIPLANAAELTVAPFYYSSQAIQPTSRFGFGLSTLQGQTPAQAVAPMITLYEDSVPTSASPIAIPASTFPTLGSNFNPFLSAVENPVMAASPTETVLIAPSPTITLTIYRVKMWVQTPVAGLNVLIIAAYPGLAHGVAFAFLGFNPNVVDTAEFTPYGNTLPPGCGLSVQQTLAPGFTGTTQVVYSAAYNP